MLAITEDQVRELLPMKEAIRLMRHAFEALGRGEAQNQARRRLILPTGSVLHSMAGAIGPYFGTKFYSTNPKGAHFFFALFDAQTGDPLARIEANALGQIRTGAASGYATDLLASPDADTLGVIGTGFQAASQIEAIRLVRPIQQVRVWSRDPERRRRFAAQMNATASESAEAAVHGADIVVTATNAKDPVLDDSWIGPGTLVNAMGSNHPKRRELPAELVRRAALIAIDSLEQGKLEAGDLLLADHWDNVTQLQAVAKQYDPHGVTIFKSLGLGVEDVAAGGFVYEQARQRPKA